VAGEWSKLLYNSYSSPGHVVRMGQGRKVYKVLMGKPKRKRPIARPRLRREDGMRMDLRETDGGVNWIRLARYRDRWRAIVISRSVNIDISRSTNVDISRSMSISRSINIYISRSIIID
jgi:hypothetical protein